MALYLGNGEKIKVNLNGALYRFNIFSSTIITNGVRLISFDDYILKDSNGLYLTAKESE